jgi:hypothetical protein
MAQSNLRGKVIVITGAVEEKMAAKQIHKTQYEKAPPAEDSPGAVPAPIAKGTDVSAGRRQR